MKTREEKFSAVLTVVEFLGDFATNQDCINATNEILDALGVKDEARRFPVLNQQSCLPRERKAMPQSVPWAFAETFREQAKENHYQTLERLAERGGLSPEEMYCAAHGLRVGRAQVDEQKAIDWLREAVKEFEAPYAELSQAKAQLEAVTLAAQEVIDGCVDRNDREFGDVYVISCDIVHALQNSLNLSPGAPDDGK
jgi:hypothetical protein